jgi:hypothetical protein
MIVEFPWRDGRREDGVVEEGGGLLVLVVGGGRLHQRRREYLVLVMLVGRLPAQNSDSWFQMVDQAGRATRSTDDPLNVRRKVARLEIRKNFFSSRVTESWNKIPSHVKNVKTVSGFKRS